MNILKKLETLWDLTTKMYKVQLNNFEGPIDLLLYFIRRDELDVYDIQFLKSPRSLFIQLKNGKR